MPQQRGSLTHTQRKMKNSLVLLFGAAARRPTKRHPPQHLLRDSTRKRTQSRRPPQVKDEIDLLRVADRTPPHLVNAAMYKRSSKKKPRGRRTLPPRCSRALPAARNCWRNHGAPVLHGPDTLDLFVGDLAAGGVAPDVKAPQRM